MKLFKIGKIVSKGKTYLIFESNYTGYIINVSKPERFDDKKVIKLFIYEHTTEYVKALYGFLTFKERILFEDLISVSGIGPRTALGMLNMGVDNIIHCIASKNINGLAMAPMVGNKTANQVIFELQEKYIKMSNNNKSAKYLPSDVANTLKTLGFNSNQIKSVINKLKPSDSIEDMVEEAIKLISSEKSISTTKL